MLERAEAYLGAAPAAIVGLLAVDGHGVPIELGDPDGGGFQLRKATAEPEVMPNLPDAAEPWV